MLLTGKCHLSAAWKLVLGEVRILTEFCVNYGARACGGCRFQSLEPADSLSGVGPLLTTVGFPASQALCSRFLMPPFLSTITTDRGSCSSFVIEFAIFCL